MLCGALSCSGNRSSRFITVGRLCNCHLAGFIDFFAGCNVAPGFMVRHIVYNGT